MFFEKIVSYCFRLSIGALVLSLTSCATRIAVDQQERLAAHCPAFDNNQWTDATLSDQTKLELVNKQNFAVPPGFQTLWFEPIQKSTPMPTKIVLCIVPPVEERGTNYGCNSAYSTYEKSSNNWVVDKQKVLICRQ